MTVRESLEVHPWAPGTPQSCRTFGSCQYLIMRTWDELSHDEQCLMVNAREHDLLPGAIYDWRTDLEFADRLERAPELGPVLIALVDQGLIEVRRLSPDRTDGSYEVISRERLPELLADRTVWNYTDRGWDHRDEGLVIVETPAGQQLTRTDRSGVPNPQASNPFLSQ
ncbi:hypothetical protein GCM10023322_38160 [Rugosimonospora acidiphila]|uniref:Uncharacterized protein n=1 Tax=Rugosimonospora acidiphila TaxID=556531 RepID=A0ABP9RY52_9ACTN